MRAQAPQSRAPAYPPQLQQPHTLVQQRGNDTPMLRAQRLRALERWRRLRDPLCKLRPSLQHHQCGVKCEVITQSRTQASRRRRQDQTTRRPSTHHDTHNLRSRTGGGSGAWRWTGSACHTALGTQRWRGRLHDARRLQRGREFSLFLRGEIGSAHGLLRLGPLKLCLALASGCGCRRRGGRRDNLSHSVRSAGL